ncbi:hypothetical protein CDG81_04680 [Actinopolyspora erythraea]|uniref:Uncharacterized protein n=1 Tax=Actinopolyspora erythraea TaxID=414996 RepID=A0A099D2A3_9ACTN|nr:hypothetical protein [Actinopolyspora erythraea]ASU77727.1 hypothetical protein CDG81_04680 [Actinopolyspora erythraea]KGI79932.1 hypothetical protein IL38_19640 [Actinopolyspora erythraea]
MDAEEVQRLAERENVEWGARPARDPAEVPRPNLPLPPEVVDEVLRSGRGEWVPYAPLGSDPDEVAERAGVSDNIVGFHAVAVGSVLVVRFRWLADTRPHDYLLRLDLTDEEPGDLLGAATLLLERLRGLATRWLERETVPLSENVSIVRPPRTSH